MRRFLIDTDTASDDAVALIMALRAPDVTVEALTIVAGNVPLDRCIQNALYTAELCGSPVPVHAGLARPHLLRSGDRGDRARHRRVGRHRPGSHRPHTRRRPRHRCPGGDHLRLPR